MEKESKLPTEEFNVKINISPLEFVKKPTKEEAGQIRKSMRELIDVPLYDILLAVAEGGCSIQPATFHHSEEYESISQKNSNFKSQQLFMLDFDEELTYEEFYSKCLDYNMLPTFTYKTFSCSVDKVDRWRAGWVIDHEVTTLEEQKNIIILLMAIFEQKADRSCKDAARLFYGSNFGLIEFENRYISYELLNEKGSPFLNKMYGVNWKQQSGISKKSFYDNANSLIIINKENLDYHKIDISFQNIKKNLDRCNLINRLPEQHISYRQGFGLVCNFINATNGGAKFITEKLSGEANDKHPWKEIVLDCQRRNYLPMKCSSFDCPYLEDCNAPGTILSKLTTKGNIITTSASKTIKPVDDCYQEIVNIMSGIKDDKKIHIIKSYTGIGKTQVYTQLPTIDGQEYTVALPTHKLKEEVYNRYKDNGIKFEKLPELPRNLDPTKSKQENEKIMNLIQSYYDIGAFDEVSKILRKFLKGKLYLNLCRKPRLGRWLVTHASLMQNPTLNHIIVIDEDPFNTLISTSEVFKSEIELLLSSDSILSPKNRDCISKFYEEVKHSIPNAVIPNTPVIVPDIENLLNAKIDLMKRGEEMRCNLIKFLHSKYYFTSVDHDRKVYFLNSNKMPEDKTIIILSATIDEYIYKKLYGDRVVWHEVSLPKLKGEIIQHTKRSCSKSGLEMYGEEIFANIPKEDVILTFKDWKKDKHCYFGNLMGLDIFKGKNISIVGTYIFPDQVYYLLAAEMGEIVLNPSKKKNLLIEYSGKKFSFFTYENPVLQKINCYCVQTELEQAIGRARVAREKCKVTVYSNFPAELTEYIY